jgi:hypothetical protein
MYQQRSRSEKAERGRVRGVGGVGGRNCVCSIGSVDDGFRHCDGRKRDVCETSGCYLR